MLEHEDLWPYYPELSIDIGTFNSAIARQFGAESDVGDFNQFAEFIDFEVAGWDESQSDGPTGDLNITVTRDLPATDIEASLDEREPMLSLDFNETPKHINIPGVSPPRAEYTTAASKNESGKPFEMALFDMGLEYKSTEGEKAFTGVEGYLSSTSPTVNHEEEKAVMPDGEVLPRLHLSQIPTDEPVHKRSLSFDHHDTPSKRTRSQDDGPFNAASSQECALSLGHMQLSLIPPAPGLAPRLLSRRDHTLVIRPKTTGRATILPLEDIFKFTQVDNHFLRAEVREAPYTSDVPWRATNAGEGTYAFSQGRTRIRFNGTADPQPWAFEQYPELAFDNKVHPIHSRIVPACVPLTALGDIEPSLQELLCYTPECTIHREVSTRLRSMHMGDVDIRRSILMFRGIKDTEAVKRDKLAHQRRQAKHWYEQLQGLAKVTTPHYKAGDMSTARGNCGVDEDCYIVDFARGLKKFPSGDQATEWTDAIAHAVRHGHFKVKFSDIQSYLDRHNLRRPNPPHHDYWTDRRAYRELKPLIDQYARNVLNESTR